jgi:uncharacterized protein
MKIKISRVPEGHSVLSQDMTVSGDNAQGLVLEGTVSCIADLDRLQAQVHARVRYQCVVQLECSRCLAPVRQPVSGEFRLVMQERSRASGRTMLPDDEVDLFFDDASGEVDLAPFIFDEILLSVPMKPLCSEDCGGVTPKGDSTVTVEYEGRQKSSDPRWKALEKLKDKNKES